MAIPDVLLALKRFATACRPIVPATASAAEAREFAVSIEALVDEIRQLVPGEKALPLRPPDEGPIAQAATALARGDALALEEAYFKLRISLKTEIHNLMSEKCPNGNCPDRTCGPCRLAASMAQRLSRLIDPL